MNLKMNKCFIYLMLTAFLCGCTNAKQKNTVSESAKDTDKSENVEPAMRFKVIFERDIKERRVVDFFLILEDHTGANYFPFNDEANYDQWAFPFYLASRVVSNYFYSKGYDAFDVKTQSYKTEFSTNAQSYKAEIESYLPYVFHLPITNEIQDHKIKELFNRLYYDYKDKQMYLEDSGYGFRKYAFSSNSTLYIERASRSHYDRDYYQYDDEFPEDAIAVKAY